MILLKVLCILLIKIAIKIKNILIKIVNKHLKLFLSEYIIQSFDHPICFYL